MFNSSNQLSGGLLERREGIANYFDLGDENEKLLTENAELHQLSDSLEAKIREMLASVDSTVNMDTTGKLVYRYSKASVVDRSTNRLHNFLTLNKGSKHGIKADMGVVGKEGIIGIIKDVSPNYCTVLSLLHKRMHVNAKVERTNFGGSLSWDGRDPRYVQLDNIAKYTEVRVGDQIVTSDSNFFPPGRTIGKIKEWKIREGDNFYSIKVELVNDFSTIDYVYIVENVNSKEIKALQERSTNE